MPWKCCVWKCKSTVKSPGIRFFRFPTVGKCLKKLAEERCEAWVSALGYGDKFSPNGKRICSQHFRSGKPARLTDTHDADWVPSLCLLRPSRFSPRSSPVNQKTIDVPETCSITRSDSTDSLKSSSSSSSQSGKSSRILSRASPSSSTSIASTVSSRGTKRSASSSPVRNANRSPGRSTSSEHNNTTSRSPSIASIASRRSGSDASLSPASETKSSRSPSSSSTVSSRKSGRNVSITPVPKAYYSYSSSCSPERSNRDSRKNSEIEDSRSENSSKLPLSQESTAPTNIIESSRECNRKEDTCSRSPERGEPQNDVKVRSFSRPNVTPLMLYDYKDDKPKMKNVSTMTEASCDPSTSNKMIDQYRRELQRLQTKINIIENKAYFCERGFEFISVTNEKCLYYTGISNVSTVKKLYEYLKPHLDSPFCNFSIEQMFVMTLTKLRLNPQFQTLAYDYNVCLNTISKYFHRTLQIMDTCLSYAIEVPSKDILLKHTPKRVKEKFGDKRIFVIDCFEIRSETPEDLKAAASHYSNYKKSETTKFLIAVCPDGNICFISPGYGGRCSDKMIVKDCGFLDILEAGDVVLADKGFDIKDLVQGKGASLNIPTFLRDKTQFHPSDIERDRQITSVRIHVERCIGVLKAKYLVMSQVVSVTSLSRFENGRNVIDLIARVCAMLYNFNPSIIPD
ncbi:uncharacterized protein LOC110674125 isoform X1 [Aedes aegypti]|uniref:Uncharacterized protein n=1 Tax=Aedes aegypti TaxID=7159 RepID=A0A6I8TNP6_AEDAE|nr:uncharacterized protein LOC110674125 isoform X1 [Aedes aegypti]